MFAQINMNTDHDFYETLTNRFPAHIYSFVSEVSVLYFKLKQVISKRLLDEIYSPQGISI